MFRVNRTGKINLCFCSGRFCVHPPASYNRCLFEFCHDGLLSYAGRSCVPQPAFVACLKKNTNFYNIVITYLRQNVQCLFCSTAITKKHSNVKGHSVVFYEMFLIHGNHTVMTFPNIYLFCKLQHVDAVVFFPRSSCGIILGRAEFKIHTGLV